MNNYLLLVSYIITKLNTRGKIKNIKNNFLLKISYLQNYQNRLS